MTDWAQMDAEDEERRARLAAPDALATAAAWYAARGVLCFPLRPGEKRPATKHGLHDASCDTAQVAAWWRDTPQANIGLPTGHLFDVIDVDGPVGYATLVDLRDADKLPPNLGVVYTPRGQHLYVPVSGHGNGAGIYPGIDYRGLGGYVVAPPSRITVNIPGRPYAPDSWAWAQPVDFAALR